MHLICNGFIVIPTRACMQLFPVKYTASYLLTTANTHPNSFISISDYFLLAQTNNRRVSLLKYG